MILIQVKTAAIGTIFETRTLPGGAALALQAAYQVAAIQLEQLKLGRDVAITIEVRS